METIAGLLTPSLLAVGAGLALGLGAVLFIVHRRGMEATISLRVPLSWAEPAEVRMVLYLLFAAFWGTAALASRLLYGAPSPGSALALVFLVVAVLASLCALCFYYAAAGTLLQAALGSRGRPAFWFSHHLSPMDRVVMSFGDLLSGWLLHPASAVQAEDIELQTADEAIVQRRPPVVVPHEEKRDLTREKLDLALREYEASLTPAQLKKLLLMREITESLKQAA
jgi:hypothetical protein